MTEQNQLQNILLLAGAGVGGYFLYKYFKEKKEEPEPPPEPEPEPEAYPISITDPYPGEIWSRALPHNVNVQIHNPYDIKKKVFVGMSMIHEEGQVFDFPVKELNIAANDIKKTSWWMQGSPQGSGRYDIIAAVWDVMPSGDCETKGTCHRLGEATSWCIFKWIPVPEPPEPEPPPEPEEIDFELEKFDIQPSYASKEGDKFKLIFRIKNLGKEHEINCGTTFFYGNAYMDFPWFKIYNVKTNQTYEVTMPITLGTGWPVGDYDVVCRIWERSSGGTKIQDLNGKGAVYEAGTGKLYDMLDEKWHDFDIK